MKLRFDNETNRVTDYESKILIEMNSTETMEDIIEVGNVGYIFKEMVDALVEKGWERQKNIFGIPQDWRKSTKDKDFSYYLAVYALIHEKTKKIGKKATLVCHSYGCINLAEFIRLFSPRDFNPIIGDIIAIGAPWGGSMNALRALMSGDTFGVSILNPVYFQEIQRTYTSLVHLIPVREVLKYPDFVHIQGDHYTHDNISQALNLSNVDPVMLRSRADIDLLINAFDRLDRIVKITNIYGTGIPTLSRLNYIDKKHIANDTLNPELYDRGDGTVGNASLSLMCDKKNYTECIQLKGIDHLQIIKLSFVWDFIGNASSL